MKKLSPEVEARLAELPEELQVRVLEKVLNRLKMRKTPQPSTKTLEKELPTKVKKES